MSDEKHTICSVLGEPYYSRFWAKVEKTESCWLWQGSTSNKGYGEFHLGRQGRMRVRALPHVLSYQMLVGKIPDGLQLDHLCRVRHCVNPEHLEPVTRKVNILRGVSWCAERARQTHCLHGHSFVGAYISKEGHRVCRACNAKRHREVYAAKHCPKVPQTHCLRGHSLSEAYVNRQGHRQCRICKARRLREYRARQGGR
jgi:hypothetical protein